MADNLNNKKPQENGSVSASAPSAPKQPVSAPKQQPAAPAAGGNNNSPKVSAPKQQPTNNEAVSKGFQKSFDKFSNGFYPGKASKKERWIRDPDNPRRMVSPEQFKKEQADRKKIMQQGFKPKFRLNHIESKEEPELWSVGNYDSYLNEDGSIAVHFDGEHVGNFKNKQDAEDFVKNDTDRQNKWLNPKQPKSAAPAAQKQQGFAPKEENDNHKKIKDWGKQNGLKVEEKIYGENKPHSFVIGGDIVTPIEGGKFRSQPLSENDNYLYKDFSSFDELTDFLGKRNSQSTSSDSNSQLGNEEPEERAKASELFGTDLNRGHIPDTEIDEDYERSWGPQEDEEATSDYDDEERQYVLNGMKNWFGINPESYNGKYSDYIPESGFDGNLMLKAYKQADEENGFDNMWPEDEVWEAVESKYNELFEQKYPNGMPKDDDETDSASAPQQPTWDKNNEPGSGVVTKELEDWVKNYLTKQVGPEFADATARNLHKNANQADWFKQKMKEDWNKRNGGN